ncbi:MAG: 50S ribosomal protein L20 [Planctomycetes bacterium]|nr:50S ribosomal protein L20 [Planctomycetota bacterium]
MGRATSGAARNKKKRRIRKLAKGFRGARGKRWRLMKEAVVKAASNAYRDRRRRRRDFRALWVIRLTAACRTRGINYSRFIFGLHAADIEVNRKMLSEVAISSPADFDAIVEIAKQHVPEQQAAA